MAPGTTFASTTLAPGGFDHLIKLAQCKKFPALKAAKILTLAGVLCDGVVRCAGGGAVRSNVGVSDHGRHKKKI